MIWRRAVADGIHKCGSCKYAIAAGEIFAETRTKLTRCEPCGRTIEDPPAVIEDAEVGVPDGVNHQPSLGFERNRMVSSGELARRHVARHVERRRR
jgi:hypothetical protein